ncbi:MAG: glycoside hydrolase family protein [Proteobacteria bacterium]|nr:glycoside hydrolase family protein [Pseudomonadota bacterium]
MRSRLKISKAGLELIERFEGLRRTAARLPDGRWTVGYGHTRSARPGAEVSQADAEALLYFDLMPVMEAVNGVVTVDLAQTQFDALVAFAHNIGLDAFRESDVLKRVNEGRLTEAALALEVWRKADLDDGSAILDALVRRRAAEKALFLNDGSALSPSGLVRPTPDAALQAALPTEPPAEVEVASDGDALSLNRVRPAAEVQPEPETPARTIAAQATVFSIAAVPPTVPPLPDEHATAPADSVVLAQSEGDTAAPAPATAEAIEAALSDDIPIETESELKTEALEAAEPGAEALAPPMASGPEQPSLSPAFVPSFDAVSYFAPSEPAPHAPEPQGFAPEPAAPEPLASAEPLLMAEDAPVGVQPASYAPVSPLLNPPMPQGWPPAPPSAVDEAPQAAIEPELTPEPAPESFETPIQALAPEPPAAEPEAPPAETSILSADHRPSPEAQTMAERGASLRLYGPMGVIGLIPGAAQQPPAAPSAPPVAAPEPATTFGPPAIPEPEVFAEIAAGPGVSTEVAPPVAELVLTPPPEDWDPDPQPQPEPVTYETEDQGTPLFDQAWAGGQTARIVRHEEPLEPAKSDRPTIGLFMLLLAVGLTAFAGSLVAFLRSKTNGADEMTWYAWILAFIGAASAGTAFYFLLKRWSGGED